MKITIKEINGNKIRFLQEGSTILQEFELESWVKLEYVELGEAEITVKEGKISFVSMTQSTPATPEPTKTSAKKSNYIVNIQGKDFMTYEGLLKKAHEKGKFDMLITESWVSEDMKRAWCKVRLTAEGQIFDGFGSSTPENTGQMTQSHPVEMSHTRAKGRALRDYLNIGQAMVEEIKQ